MKKEGQALLRKWYIYRCAKITAFKFGAAIKSNDNQPPKSLVKAIHNSESVTFTTATTRSKSLIKTCVSNYGHVYALTANLICFLKFSIQHETKAK